jgi:hypothetical protein
MTAEGEGVSRPKGIKLGVFDIGLNEELILNGNQTETEDVNIEGVIRETFQQGIVHFFSICN